MRNLVRTIVTACVLGLHGMLPCGLHAKPPEASVQPSRPNVILVLIDDMGWSDLSCFGGTQTKTENIDKLAGEGLRFHSFYVNAPICSPSRTALSTGVYPHRFRVTSYLAERKLNDERGTAQWLDPAAPMLARALQSAGYATGHFGKWHMGGQRDVGEAPLIEEYGFDSSLTNFEGLGPRVLPLCDAFDGSPVKKHDLGSGLLGRGSIQWLERSKITSAYCSAAVSFIDDSVAAGKPFYINLWPDDVHSPFFPSEEGRRAAGDKKRALYYTVLKEMDHALGRVFDRVRSDPRLRDNTLILVMSDNGHEAGAGMSKPLRGGKTWLYEGGIRSPLIVWGPGLQSKDARNTINRDTVFCALDLNRSLYALTGVAPPKEDQTDGEDVSPALLGKNAAGRAAPIFWRRPPDRPGNETEDNPDLAVRSGRWKFLMNYDRSDRRLYDLQVDESEKNNVIEDNVETADRLEAALLAWNIQLPKDAGDPTFTKRALPATSDAK